ncbi:hypothetical protein [Nigerium massiliense]|uniref:hypothetical protein n=1 Tax=Nigerium massiliense TaxID=1522317 RepID=UPI0011C9E489|nr:hypothetical protein [Nigerium massiliense]
MPDDLADRISEGAVAVLELVPGEKRFVDLTRHVLRGGAERFRPVLLPDEPVRYLVPVGVPGKKLDFGTLLVQRSRVSLVWRTDPARPYHAVICTLSDRTTVSQTAVVVRGETWGRFDMRDDTASMTFLVPPVATPGLPRALHEALIDEPDSRVARFATAPLAPSITTDPGPDDAGFLDERHRRADPDSAAPTEIIPASADVEARPVEPDASQAQASVRAAGERQDTARPEAAERPDAAQCEAATQVLPSATRGRVESTSDAPDWSREASEQDERADLGDSEGAGATQVLPLVTDRGPAESVVPPPREPRAARRSQEPASAPARRSEASEIDPGEKRGKSLLGPDTTRGFIVGLLATLLVGAVFLVLQLLGG